MKKTGFIGLLLALSFLPGLAFCKEPQEVVSERSAEELLGGVRVTRVQMGSLLTSSGQLAVPRTLFKPADSAIIVSVETWSGHISAGTLGVNLVYNPGPDAQAVGDQMAELIFHEEGNTNFTFKKPTPWPAGEYSAEVFLDGKSVQVIKFRVN